MKYLKYLFAIILLLLVFFLAKGFFTPSVYYEREVIVNKPAEEAWAVMSDESNLPKWIKGFKRTEHISGKANSVGAVSKVYIQENDKEMVMEETVTSVIPNEELGMTFTMDFMDMDYHMSFKEKEGKTYIKTRSKTTGNGIFAKSLISFMTGSMKAQEGENLNTLKQLIEKNTKNYFPEPIIESINESLD